MKNSMLKAFPLELKYQIVEKLITPDLKKLRLVSKEFYEVSTPTLFGSGLYAVDVGGCEDLSLVSPPGELVRPVLLQRARHLMLHNRSAPKCNSRAGSIGSRVLSKWPEDALKACSLELHAQDSERNLVFEEDPSESAKILDCLFSKQRELQYLSLDVDRNFYKECRSLQHHAVNMKRLTSLVLSYANSHRRVNQDQMRVVTDAWQDLLQHLPSLEHLWIGPIEKYHPIVPTSSLDSMSDVALKSMLTSLGLKRRQKLSLVSLRLSGVDLWGLGELLAGAIDFGRLERLSLHYCDRIRQVMPRLAAERLCLKVLVYSKVMREDEYRNIGGAVRPVEKLLLAFSSLEHFYFRWDQDDGLPSAESILNHAETLESVFIQHVPALKTLSPNTLHYSITDFRRIVNGCRKLDKVAIPMPHITFRASFQEFQTLDGWEGGVEIGTEGQIDMYNQCLDILARSRSITLLKVTSMPAPPEEWNLPEDSDLYEQLESLPSELQKKFLDRLQEDYETTYERHLQLLAGLIARVFIKEGCSVRYLSFGTVGDDILLSCAQSGSVLNRLD